MAQWFSTKDEVIFVVSLVIILTVMEAMNTNLYDNLHDSWKVRFPEEIFLSTTETIFRTAIVGISLFRGVTVQVYLAAHLLLFIPVITHRLRFVIVIWLLMFSIRTLFINFLAMVIGLLLCSSLPSLHPACFHFIGIKGLELGTSIFVWLIIHNFLLLLRRYNVQSDVPESTAGYDIPWTLPELADFYLSERQSLDEDSEYGESLLSILTTSLRRIFRKRIEGLNLSQEEKSEKIASDAVTRLLEDLFGVRFHDGLADLDDKATKKFLEVHVEDIERFILKVENYINLNRLRKKCIHTNCLHCQYFKKKGKNAKEKKRERLPNYGMHYVDYSHSHDYVNNRKDDIKLKKYEEKLKKEFSIQGSLRSISIKCNKTENVCIGYYLNQAPHELLLKLKDKTLNKELIDKHSSYNIISKPGPSHQRSQYNLIEYPTPIISQVKGSTKIGKTVKISENGQNSNLDKSNSSLKIIDVDMEDSTGQLRKSEYLLTEIKDGYNKNKPS